MEGSTGGPIRRGEGSYRWMKRQPAESNVRMAFGRMMRWVDEYPPVARADLFARLQSKHQAQFDGAYFELFVYRLLSKVLKVDPLVPAGSPRTSRPDFEVRGGFVEATVFEDVEAESSIDSDGMDILREATPKVRTTGFALFLERFQRGDSEPSKGRVALLIDKMLKKCSHDELLKISERAGQKHDLKKLPTIALVDDPSGWSWSVRPIPLQNADARPKSIVANSGEGKVVYVRTAERMREAISAKIAQHVRVDRPLVVAVCCNHWPGCLGVDDVAEALLGSEYWQVEKQGPGVEGPFRHADGLWTNPRGTRDKPSAIIVTSMCRPWITPESVMLWTNPKAPAIEWLSDWPFWRCHWPIVPGPWVLNEGRVLQIEELA